jgi:hypothetical protein
MGKTGEDAGPSITEEYLLTVLAETGPKTFNLDIAAEVHATLVISKCAWCQSSFIQLAPHQMFCSTKCRVTAFRKREPGELRTQ